MSLIPEEELSPKGWMNLTPMVDFLFLILAVFAVLAMTRTSLFTTEIHLAKVQDAKAVPPLVDLNTSVVNLSV
ncbi:MAG: hypothetical protein FJZ58_00940, partial [Chlamydiae bacterium]|nr:hypothetical protein [Chlamydiota bacterium]